MTDQELLMTCDSLKGCINRMMVTDDLKELMHMYEWAERYLQKIHVERVKELDKHGIG